MPRSTTVPDDRARPQPLFISPREAAYLLGLSENHVYRLLASGVISSRKEGRRRLVSRQSVLEYAENAPDNESA